MNRSWRGRPVAAGALIALALGAGLVAVSTVAAGVDRAALIAAAMKARTVEASASRAHSESMLTAAFTGKALEIERAAIAHYRDLEASGSVLPGEIAITNVTLLDSYGSADSQTLDIRWHERLANVLNGTVKDYSESNLIWHYVLLREGGTWKVADMAPQFVPGQGP
ncbi:MAG: hypothetical protein ACR2KI_01050 [Candidatus Limnocylindria bacterium]